MGDVLQCIVHLCAGSCKGTLEVECLTKSILVGQIWLLGFAELRPSPCSWLCVLS